jgi:signal transduction histidine kinase
MNHHPFDLSTEPSPVDRDAAERRSARADSPILLHDIRNHLNAACGLVELMSAGVMRIGTHDAIDVAQKSLQSVLAKLELLRVDMPEGEPGGARIDDVECVRFTSELCAAFSLMARQRGATLRCQPVETALYAKVDALALNRVLSNLVVNAIRHSGADDIEVCVRGRDSGVVFLVRDNGVGLPQAAKEALQHLQSGRTAPTGYMRHGLRSCVQAAALAGVRLRLVNEWSPGVCWELALDPEQAAGRPSHVNDREVSFAELVDH